MKKDRNAFFESSQVTSSFMQNPMMQQHQMNMQPQMMPYQAASNNSSFYAGQSMPNYTMNTYPSTTSYADNDLDNKISRLERQIQKLESRVSKLESLSAATNKDDDINITSNMYMI